MGPHESVDMDCYSAAAIRAWNLCGGEFRIDDVDTLAELEGADDVEVFLHALTSIRNFVATRAADRARG